ncbi:MAG: carboxypeptidase regulatory-like domain-containing protein [Gemmatimonadaceae bacterium]
MKLSRVVLGGAALVWAVAAFLPRAVTAQGVTTGAVGGVVTGEDGQPLANVQIRVTNRASGASAGALTRENGRYLVPGLEVGGPYEVSARRIGFEPQTRANQYVPLSQVLKLDFVMSQRAAELQGVQITASTTSGETFTASNTSVKTVVTDTAIQRIPTLSRNLVDFIKLVPQASASGPGYSGGGMSNRMNNVQIDGATERDVFGLGSTGQPGAQANSKSVSLEAVKEFQVLLAPFDVRQGNFGGLLLNAVTKSGTNQLQGSAFYAYRNQDYGRDVPVLRATSFDRTTYGFSLGGPIIKDKLHFFVVPEFQQEHSPLSGPFQGQASSAAIAFPIRDADIARFNQIMGTLGEQALGSAGATEIPNPLTNFFGRLDWKLSDQTRVVLRYNYGHAELLRAQNARNSTRAVYTANLHDFSSTKHAPVVQIYSNFKNGTFNEMFLGYNQVADRRNPKTSFPQITVSSLTQVDKNGAVVGNNATILGGSDQFSQGNELDTKTYELTDNFTIPRGNHSFVIGTRNEVVKLRNLFTQSSFGVWSFRGLDSLAAGNANSFRKALILSQGGNVYFDALQSAWYAQDQWQYSPRLAITMGVRLDYSKFLTDLPYNAAIDSAYGRRTDDIPRNSVQFSPRIGFNWDITGDQKNQLRGGAGLFVGTPPYVWLENAYVNSGNIITFLNCNTSGSTSPAPAFTLNIANINVCRDGKGTAPIGDVNFLDKSLKFPQPMRLALGYDRQLKNDVVLSFDALFSKNLNQFFFVNRNLKGPQMVDRYGRTVYASSISLTGSPVTVVPDKVIANGGTARFSTAIDIENQNKDFSWSFTPQLRKRFSNHWEGGVAYTYARSRDVQSFTSSTHISNWQFGRTLSTAQEDPLLGISLFDQTHKLSANGTYTWEWKRGWGTDFSLFYQGFSGTPHDYVYAGASSTSGDLNGDGRNGNDLLYVPRNANDGNEIQFRTIGTGATAVTAQAQADAFEKFIQNSDCLSRYRGQILKRNICKQPFTNQMDLAIRQSIPTLAGQRFSVQFDVFNFGNLLNKNWGQQKVTEANSGANSNVPILTHVGQTTTDPRTAVNIVQFNTNLHEYSVGNFASNYWRTQLSVRYSF